MAADRSIKLIKDFGQKLTTNENQKQFFLQISPFNINLN